MRDSIKMFTTKFPRVDRELFIKAETDNTVIVWVTNGSTGEIVRLKRFEDYGKAMNYYSEHFTRKFQGCDMVSACESYFSALRKGYPLWEV